MQADNGKELDNNRELDDMQVDNGKELDNNLNVPLLFWFNRDTGVSLYLGDMGHLNNTVAKNNNTSTPNESTGKKTNVEVLDDLPTLDVDDVEVINIEEKINSKFEDKKTDMSTITQTSFSKNNIDLIKNGRGLFVSVLHDGSVVHVDYNNGCKRVTIDYPNNTKRQWINDEEIIEINHNNYVTDQTSKLPDNKYFRDVMDVMDSIKDSPDIGRDKDIDEELMEDNNEHNDVQILNDLNNVMQILNDLHITENNNSDDITITELESLDMSYVNNIPMINNYVDSKETITYPKLGDVVKNGFRVILDLNEVKDELSTEEKEQENEELTERPIGEDCDYTKEQLDIRIRFAKRITKDMYKDALKQDKNLADCYITHPPYMYYTTKESHNNKASTPIRRFYGVFVDTDGEYRAHAVTAMLMFNNRVIGGVPLDDMVPSENLTDAQLEHLKCGLIRGAGAFKDPLGFIAFV
jgi:hypothetical protein